MPPMSRGGSQSSCSSELCLGGNISDGMKDRNISDNIALPPLCHKLHSELDDTREKFMVNPVNTKFLNAAK